MGVLPYNPCLQIMPRVALVPALPNCCQYVVILYARNGGYLVRVGVGLDMQLKLSGGDNLATDYGL